MCWGRSSAPFNPKAARTDCDSCAIDMLQGKVAVDVGFWGGMVPANSHDAGELRAMLDAGALGFKAFLSPSGVLLT